MSNLPATTTQSAGQISVFSGNTNQFAEAQRMAKALCSSTLVPEIYRGESNLGNSLIALELANRTGASVLAVMQSMTPIHGKPSWSSAFLIATVNTCGRFTPIRFKFQGKENSDDWGCRAVAKDKESGEELVGSLITIGMAKAEGWYGKNGSKWKTMPEQMLTYRAAAFWTRAYAPEVSLGMHTAEEVSDMVNVTPTTLPKGLKEEKPNPALDEPSPVVDAEVVPVSEAKAEAAPAPEPTPHDKFTGWLNSIGATPERFVEVANREEWFEQPIESVESLTPENLAWVRAKNKVVAKTMEVQP